MASKKAEIPVWGPGELAAEAGRYGKAGAKLSMGPLKEPPARVGGFKVAGATAQEKAVNLVAKLKEMKLV